MSKENEVEGSPLEQLAAASGREFPNLLKARDATHEGLEERRASLGQLPHDDDVAVVLMGSWGRAELTAGSDDDFMILVRGTERDGVRPSIEDVKTVLRRAPGDQGIFGKPVASDQLIGRIESVYATCENLHEAVTSELVDRYLDESVKDFRVPRFLLNDVVRYWRTPRSGGYATRS